MKNRKRVYLSLVEQEEQKLNDLYSDYVSKGGKHKLARYCKEKLLSKNNIEVKVEISNDAITKAIFELNKIGVNINQLMKKMSNENKLTYHLPEMQANLNVVNNTIKVLMSNVDRG